MSLIIKNNDLTFNEKDLLNVIKGVPRGGNLAINKGDRKNYKSLVSKGYAVILEFPRNSFSVTLTDKGKNIIL